MTSECYRGEFTSKSLFTSFCQHQYFHIHLYLIKVTKQGQLGHTGAILCVIISTGNEVWSKVILEFISSVLLEDRFGTDS